MRVTTLVNRVFKFKSFVCEKTTFEELPGGGERLLLHFRARVNAKAVCRRCGEPGPGYDSAAAPREFVMVPLWGMTVALLYRMRRVDCAVCRAVVVEAVPWATGKETTTAVFQALLASWAKDLPWKRVAERFRVSWQTVFRSVTAAVEWGLANRSLDGVEAIGVDEIKHTKNRKFMTVVYELTAGRRRLLWCGEDHKAVTLERFFNEMDNLSPGFSKRIRFVCSDMWKAYLSAIRARIPNAMHVLDRFHVRKLFSDAVDKSRRAEAAEMRRNGEQPVLAKTRWALLKKRENLTDSQADTLDDLLGRCLKTVKVYLLCEEFERFWDYVSPAWAGKFLDSWAKRAADSGIDPVQSVGRTLTTHRELLLNWFRAKKEISNGVTEGLNLNAKLAIRKARGFRSFKVAQIALYHQMGDLPEPDFHRQFW